MQRAATSIRRNAAGKRVNEKMKALVFRETSRDQDHRTMRTIEKGLS